MEKSLFYEKRPLPHVNHEGISPLRYRSGRNDEECEPNSPHYPNELNHPNADMPTKTQNKNKEGVYILGIDPGLSEVGFGLLKMQGPEVTCVDYGIIKTTPQFPFAERLTMIKADLLELIAPYSIAAAGMEELFFVKNVTNGIKVAHARGVLVQSLHEKGITVHDFRPREIKQSVCGYGAADKLQVQEMVKRILKLKTLPKPHDAADALAVALCMVEAWKKNI